MKRKLNIMNKHDEKQADDYTDYLIDTQPIVDTTDPMNWDLAQIERAYMSHYSQEVLMVAKHHEAQPMVEKVYDVIWMMRDSECDHYYNRWFRWMGITSSTNVFDEDALFIRELELVSLGGC